jgi:hypothetical protein
MLAGTACKKADKASAISDGLASLAVTNAAMITTLEARNSIASKAANEDAIMREKDALMRMYFSCVEALKDPTLSPERRAFMQSVCDKFEAGN